MTRAGAPGAARPLLEVRDLHVSFRTPQGTVHAVNGVDFSVAPGGTVVVPRTEAEIEEEPGVGLAVVGETLTLSELVEGLNALGVSPRDLIEILKTIKAAGALHAEFIVQ